MFPRGIPATLRTTYSTPLRVIKNPPAGQQTEPPVLTTGDGSTSVDHASHGTKEHICLPKLDIRRSSGRGLGLFAVDRIPAYTRILEDDALLSLASGEDLPELWQKYCLLPPDLRSQFDSLSFPVLQSSKWETLVEKLAQRGYTADEAKRMSRVNSRFQANAFNTGVLINVGVINKEPSAPIVEPTWKHALFPTVARINHSCIPNAHVHYRPSSGSQLAYSLRDIEPGEEIEIAYFDMTMALSDRQARSKSWGFTCACPACNESGIFRGGKYERQLARVHAAIALESNLAFYYRNNEDLIRGAREAIDIASSPEYSWLVAALPNLYHNLGAWLGNARRPDDEVREAMITALRWECRITGADSHPSEERRKFLRSYDDALSMFHKKQPYDTARPCLPNCFPSACRSCTGMIRNGRKVQRLPRDRS